MVGVIVMAVPVKDLVNAKQRLLSVLSPTERAALAQAMLRDVLQALTGAHLDAVWVVTRDPAVIAAARPLGAEIVPEGANAGHTAAVGHAQTQAAGRGARVFATVPGDVPCVTAEEIRALLSAVGGPPGAVFVPSCSGLGTNGVALSPPDLMPLTFGEPSFENHLATAARHGLVARVLRLPRMGLDIDTPGDLRALLGNGLDTESGRLLAAWSIADRLNPRPSAGSIAP
jgi:2-phospho-L-lactate/phosphoenolpyruvate guanylyltransferase